jgi:hypothetical protein
LAQAINLLVSFYLCWENKSLRVLWPPTRRPWIVSMFVNMSEELLLDQHTLNKMPYVLVPHLDLLTFNYYSGIYIRRILLSFHPLLLL